MMTLRLFHAPLFLAALLCGCNNNLYFSDDEGAPRPGSSIFSEHPDELSLPYALGTQVKIAVQGKNPADAVTWQIRSDAPTVFRVDKVAVDQNTLGADCTAVGEGVANLQLVDGSGKQQRSAQVSVMAPDRGILLAHGPLRILGLQETSFPHAQVQQARVLTGGKGVFGVAYYHGEQRVYGRGIATIDAPANLMVQNQTSSGLATNEWLFITPQADDDYMLNLSSGGKQLLSVPVSGLPESQIASLALLEEVTEKKDDNQQIWVLAQARDGMNTDIHGAYSTWTLSGAQQTGDGNPMQTMGDLYRYEYDPAGAPQPLIATRGAHTATLSIKAHKGSVNDTTYLGCNAGRGRGGGGAGVFVLLLVLLGATARRSAWWSRSRSAL